VIGRMSRAWYRARDLGKTYFQSLDHLIRSRRAERKADDNLTEESEEEEVENASL
jgi:hypothetical protein